MRNASCNAKQQQQQQQQHRRRTTAARRRLHSALLAAAALFGAAGCSSDDATGPTTKPTADLHIVRRADAAPPLLTTTASFYAKKGEDRELRLFYAPAAGSGGSVGAEFLRLRVRANSLDRRPDGSAIAVGDSVLITVTADPTLMTVDFQPTGLRFSAAEPAELKLRFAECDGDYDGDGDVDATDAVLKTQIAIWSQEAPTEPWTKQSTALLATLDATTTLAGFTGYAIAY
jgi:hypothetical protein